MKFIVDENVSYSVVEALEALGHTVISIAREFSSIKDNEVYNKAVEEEAILVTRDYHFTNPILFPSENTAGIIYIKPGNLTSVDEVNLITKFLNNYNFKEMKGSLITLYKNGIIKIRGSKISDE